MGNDNSQAVKGIGILSAQAQISKGNKMQLDFSDVHYIPELRHNLRSVAKLTDHGATVLFDKQRVTINLPSGTVLRGHRGSDHLYRIPLKVDQALLTQPL